MKTLDLTVLFWEGVTFPNGLIYTKHSIFCCCCRKKNEALKQSASQSGAQIEDDVLFFEAAEGFNKKETVYGRGSESEAYYERPTTVRHSARATYTPSVLSQMEARLKKIGERASYCNC